MTVRLALGAVCASTLIALTGCSSGAPSEAASSSSTGPTPAVAPQQVQSVATRAISRAGDATRAGGADSRKARRAAFTGPALRAADADAKLADVSPQLAPPNPALTNRQPTPLAVTQGKPPSLLLVQTGAGDGDLPQLQLLESAPTGGSWKVAEAATMLPGASVQPFPALAKGTPTLAPRQESGLAVAPADLVRGYAKSLAHPSKPVPDRSWIGDDFAARVRQSAREQASATEAYASFTQRHEVLPDATHVIRQQDGSALVFAVLERTDTFDVAKHRVLNAPKEFTAFVPKQDRINKRARMTTLEFLVFQVPRGTGKASLVAASEHLVGARGH